MQIWRQFNRFIVCLDKIPISWEEKTAFYCAHLIEKKRRSTTILSYVSAIKFILKADGYKWKDDMAQIGLLVRACKVVSDEVKTRLPINGGLLELILFELKRILDKQPYLLTLYRAMLIIGYYGMFRIGELSAGPHVIKPFNVHIGKNKNKIMIILYSSKTHSKSSYPQKIKISGNSDNARHFCPFDLMHKYINARPQCLSREEQFFVFSDRSRVKLEHVRNIIRKLITNMGLQGHLYDTHSLRIGRSCDLLKKGHSIDEIKLLIANAVYKYLRKI